VSVREITAAPDRNALIDYVFDHPHDYTTEDIKWLNQKFGLPLGFYRDAFKQADRVAAVFKDGLPLYLFGIMQFGGQSVMNTASESRLDQSRVFFTKSLLRWMRSAEGQEFHAGTVGLAEQGDKAKGWLNEGWLEKIGYRPYGEYEYQGEKFTTYYFAGA
jgi:hypothetical protein